MPPVGFFACQPAKTSNIMVKFFDTNLCRKCHLIAGDRRHKIILLFPENVSSHLDVYGATDCITKICFRAAECMYHMPRRPGGKANHRLKWYDTECYSKKKELR